jgi:hypothetical protein
LIHVSTHGSFMNSSYIANEYGQLDNFAVEPEVYVDAENTAGWTAYAEKLNGRLAMIGFVALIATELIGGDTLFHLLLLR